MKNNIRDNYTLRRLLPAQWEAYKSIRLEALQTNPDMFGSNYKKEATYTPDEWISFLQNDRRAQFALYYNESLVGLTGVTLDKAAATNAVLFASFIQPAHRGNGLSTLFYEARIDWARSQNCKTITVSHRVGNDVSKAANQRFGFVYAHAKEVMWPDGVSADELVYVLEL
ncbi:GNAT family N-acetyltransferase [Chitinophaga nivalis]|uniref:GNAT family N-acetyltransferase n=1 Tax=Chitinophaga nivalis TaxID=2991709 RepID=A0ABT3IK68_9BACT|nr:GNAT family N-acetyltransferase [Chitinophaga nivalis]MCW3465970.1 GNAT family N-acetyltransferase [Chitinophaga nivalis]MCW3484339.1 GNAT family N-acetyltransferase [Chitinophaga nivalis]